MHPGLMGADVLVTLNAAFKRCMITVGLRATVLQTADNLRVLLAGTFQTLLRSNVCKHLLLLLMSFQLPRLHPSIHLQALSLRSSSGKPIIIAPQSLLCCSPGK